MTKITGDNWDDIADWWENEASSDPAFGLDVHPLFDELVAPLGDELLDLGCGEGQAMRRVGRSVIGVDLSHLLATKASQAGPVVVAELPDLGSIRTDAVDGAYSVYLLDLIADHSRFLAECARVIRPGGHLVVVINHPVYTAPGSSPIEDEDGEVLWRWGAYFTRGSSVEQGGGRDIVFHHRSLADLLTEAADAGWMLEMISERPLSADTIARLPGYHGQEHIPRLLGIRWRNRVGGAR